LKGFAASQLRVLGALRGRLFEVRRVADHQTFNVPFQKFAAKVDEQTQLKAG
jgi:hypothetical protein